ncbi:MAG: hypothetical protein LUQ65_01405 [Candidatus Helarchaeota archaeon]|nr:hypothetical protein [Candidatus Helarchaeota archaeon]
MAKKRNGFGNFTKASRDLGMLVAEQDKNLGLYYVGREQYLDRALDINDPIIFFMGPKGIGKSAILQMVRLERQRDEKRIIDIAPDDLAFSAFANVKMESPLLTDALRGQWLFKSLWDYVLLMEIWERENPDAKSRFEQFKSLFVRTEDEKRIQKLFQITVTDTGNTLTFTDRIMQLVREVELSAQIGSTNIKGKVGIEHPSSSRFELLAEVNHAIKTLPGLLKHQYYILIDDLDLHWQNEPNQNAFISSLFLSLRKLARPPLKFLVSIRNDIYNCLPLADKDKSRDRLCDVEWNLLFIKEMIEKRLIAALDCSQKDVWGNVFPQNGFETLAKHSTKKPREFIRMTSLCLARAATNGHRRVHDDDISEAIRTYSAERAQDLVSDLRYTYPKLDVVIENFRGKSKEFPFKTIDELTTKLALEALERQDAPWFWAGQFDERAGDFAELLADIGFLQVKENRTAVPKPYDREKMGRINCDIWLSVHPMYAPGLDLLGA